MIWFLLNVQCHKVFMNKISINNINNTIEGYLKDENFDRTRTFELNNFIDKNLRRILQQTNTSEAKDLQANLLALSNKINKEIDTPQAHKLSFDIMGIALGLLSAEKNNYLQEDIPSDVFSIILGNLNPNNSARDIRYLKSIERTSKMWMTEIEAYVFRKINEEKLSLSKVGCKTDSEAINYIIKNKLQSANLSNFHEITDEDLKKIIENCPHLHTIFLQYSDKLKEVPFEKLQALQCLDIAGCLQLSGDKLTEALGKLQALQSLNLERCGQLSGDKLAVALGKLTALRSLNLVGCRQLSGDKLAETLGQLTALQSLEFDCGQLSADKLVEALGKLTALQSLDIAGCNHISEDQLAEVLCKLTTLKSIILARCTQLSENKLAGVLGKLTALQSLNLAWCDQLTGDKLAEALGKLTALQSLILAGCWQLSGDKLIEALGKLQDLQRLNLAGCWQLSGDKLIEALRKLQALENLQLSRDILTEAVDKLKARGVVIDLF